MSSTTTKRTKQNCAAFEEPSKLSCDEDLPIQDTDANPNINNFNTDSSIATLKTNNTETLQSSSSSSSLSLASSEKCTTVTVTNGVEKIKSDLTLPLNVIVTDTEDDRDGDKLNQRTKKFYESDDPFISTIFSQTINSTSVTPTDEECSYIYDLNVVDDHDQQSHSLQEHEKTGVGDQLLTMTSITESQLSEHSSCQDSQTETFDIYKEPEQCMSLIDKIRSDDIGGGSGGCGIISDTELSPFEKDQQIDSFYEDHLNRSHMDHQQRPSIVIDFCNEDNTPSDPLKTEDIAKGSYFDQTIEEDFDPSFDLDDNDPYVDDGSSVAGADNIDCDLHHQNNHSPCMAKKSAKVQKDCDIESPSVVPSSPAPLSPPAATTESSTALSSTSSSTTVLTTTSTTTTVIIDNQDEIIETKTEKTKKKSSESSSGKKKSKKSRKSDAEKENISVTSESVNQTDKQSELMEHLSTNDTFSNATYCCCSLSSPFTIKTNQNIPSIRCPADDRCCFNTKTIQNSAENTQRNGLVIVNSDDDMPSKIHLNNHRLIDDDDDDNDNTIQRPVSCSIISSNMPLHEDDLSNINVKNLKKYYLMDQSNGVKKIQGNECRVSIGNVVSVKQLCHSFGDLTTICKADKSSNIKLKTINRVKSVCDLRKLEQLPIQTGVSVKALRDSYCNLTGLCESFENSKSSKTSKYCRVSLGIKQFDMKSSFSKFDALQKKNIFHVRSSDAGKAQDKFNGIAVETEKNCKSCDKQVYKMEEIKAEKSIWHRQCFKCSECLKQLNVDTYESHESVLYCKPHFKTLFTPKAVENNDRVIPQKPELIIRENQPVELPPDVVRSSDKTDLGLEELHQLNVRSRYQIFENSDQPTTPEKLNSTGLVKRSPSILSKLAKFQAKGIDVGLNDENVAEIDESSSDDNNDGDELDDENDDDIDLIRVKRAAQRERPLSFANMNDIKSRFEKGHAITKEERREERKQEIQNIRSRLFLGKQAKIKEMYQQAVLESEQGIRAVDRKPDMDIGDKARHIKDLFEKGEVYKDDENEMDAKNNDQEWEVFEKGIGKKSRTLFMEMDAAAKTPTTTTPMTPSPKTPTPRTPDTKRYIQPNLEDVIKYDEKVDDVKIETADISNKFKFFETYKPTEKEKKAFRITPPRDGVAKQSSPDITDDNNVYIDPDIVRSSEIADDPTVAQRCHTTTKFLSMFREMEEKKDTSKQYDGMKPLKRFTPPPDDGRRLQSDESENDCTDSDDDDEDDDDIDDNDDNDDDEHERLPNYVRSSDKDVDEYLIQSKSAARAKQLRAKFEKWESKELAKEQNNSSVMLYDGNEQSQIESAKEIRAKFESMRDSQNRMEQRDRVKVNRFV